MNRYNSNNSGNSWTCRHSDGVKDTVPDDLCVPVLGGHVQGTLSLVDGSVDVRPFGHEDFDDGQVAVVRGDVQRAPQVVVSDQGIRAYKRKKVVLFSNFFKLFSNVFTVNGINISVSLKNPFEVFAVAIPKLNAESRKLGLEFVCRAHFEKSPVFGHFGQILHF